MVSFYSDLLLGNGNSNDLYTRPEEKKERRCNDYRFHGSPFLQIHACRRFPMALCRTGQRKLEDVRLHPDAFLFYLFGVGNVYGLSV